MENALEIEFEGVYGKYKITQEDKKHINHPLRDKIHIIKNG